ncbi:hypothetical protein [Streptomyces sp. NPDC087294]|uniref:hypothetical protein n=1 Tax=Streptomyces sp. NPDC087294 TaxID=3365777 RepID=UPI003805A309
MSRTPRPADGSQDGDPGDSHDHHDAPSHAGNGTVNDGQGEQRPEGLDSDELALRRMLHQAVRTVEPADGTLDHLRRAVPARRARKRHAAVGMAAAALFVGTAIPALVHVSNATGSDVNPSVAGQASQAQGGAGAGKDDSGATGSDGSASGKVQDKGGTGGDSGDKGKTSGAGQGSSAGGDPSASAASAGLCTAAQLGSATENTDQPDATGAVYGTFRVYNVSGTPCGVDAAGSIGALAQGAADATKITTARHVAGDAASALPDPAADVASVVLRPGDAYAVRFAWVPSETCPTTGGGDGGTDTGGATATPTPTEAASSSSGSATGSTDSSGVTSQLLTEEGTADGSVVITHTAVTGSPTVSATVSNACAGTVYYTGLLTGT